ncbi:hypothetical protein Tsp_11927, partial [Trichinella spiralis]|uniref:hypothetical protein n=1 Tax=Trichinella spiralis TaxID=6334 RepID=UPI0001EFD202
HFEAGRKVYQFPRIIVGDVLLFHKLHILQLRYLYKIGLFLHLCSNFSSCENHVAFDEHTANYTTHH